MLIRIPVSLKNNFHRSRPSMAISNLHPKTGWLLCILICASLLCRAQQFSIQNNGINEEHRDHNTIPTSSVLIAKRVNLYIFSRSPKFSLATFIIRNTTRFQRLFNSRKMAVITIRRADEMPAQLAAELGSNGTRMLGTLWIDSHGVYKTGRALFVLGKDTIDYATIRRDEIARDFLPLQPYCDTATKIIIGACYAAASYIRPGNEQLVDSRMNGDSLMMALGALFPKSSVYGTSSWIMTTPMLFGHDWALAGHPLERKFWDEIYQPVWNSMGSWFKYSRRAGNIERVNTVYLDRHGNMQVNEIDWIDAGRHREKMEKNLAKLKTKRRPQAKQQG